MGASGQLPTLTFRGKSARSGRAAGRSTKHITSYAMKDLDKYKGTARCTGELWKTD